ncbi:MAG: hypothetical protein SVY53_01545 [Chloroflexota bacterium]|nr:hypothetical protein [Chloroflexota bacterium]
MALILGMEEEDLRQIADRELPRVCLFCDQFTFMGNPEDGRCHWGAKPGLMVGQKTSGNKDARGCPHFQWQRGWLGNMAVRAQGGWLKFYERYDREFRKGSSNATKI